MHSNTDSTQPMHQAFGPSVPEQDQAVAQTGHYAHGNTTPLQAVALLGSNDGSPTAQQQTWHDMQSVLEQQQHVVRSTSWHHYSVINGSVPQQGKQDLDTVQQANHSQTGQQMTHHDIEDSATNSRLQLDDHGGRQSFDEVSLPSPLWPTGSLQERVHGQDGSGTPSFMRPTVSSLVHSASRQRSLRKSQSEHVV